MFPAFIRRDVIMVLCLKAAALALIYFLFIAPATRPEPGSGAVTVHILGGAP